MATIKYHWTINDVDVYMVGNAYGLICGNFNRIETTHEFYELAVGKGIVRRIGVSEFNDNGEVI